MNQDSFFFIPFHSNVFDKFKKTASVHEVNRRTMTDLIKTFLRGRDSKVSLSEARDFFGPNQQDVVSVESVPQPRTYTRKVLAGNDQIKEYRYVTL